MTIKRIPPGEYKIELKSDWFKFVDLPPEGTTDIYQIRTSIKGRVITWHYQNVICDVLYQCTCKDWWRVWSYRIKIICWNYKK